VKAFPHRYQVGASAQPEGEVLLTSAGLATLPTQPPAEFGGPGDRWSPETLLCGALADCFVLTFRAIARASALPWISLDVDVVGTLDREDRQSRFTRFDVQARLRIAADADAEAALRALHKAEAGCLISNSLSGEHCLTAVVDRLAAVADPDPPPCLVLP
jgi:organic hydroperoxide reductase OsmC/OhrA